MKERRHGIASTYNRGCRCERCRNAHAVRNWVMNNCRDWDAPLLANGAYSLVPDFTKRKGCVEITSDMIYGVFKEYEGRIKIAVLKKARALGQHGEDTVERRTK